MTAAVFEERSDPGQVASALLAAAIHVLLLLVLIFGVRWQNRPPDSVVVELWNEPPPAPVQVQAEPKPAPAVEPAPPPKPEPVIPKPEIVEKKALEPKPVPKLVPKLVPKPLPKPAPKLEPKPLSPKPVAAKAPAKPRDEEAQRQIREQLQREQTSLANDRERQQIKDLLARESAAASSSALATWKGKVASHIRSRIRVEIAQAVPGNPEAIFEVTILPSYEVLKVSKVKSSGNAAYDDDVERAILKSSPLPRPDRADLFERALRLTFRPKD